MKAVCVMLAAIVMCGAIFAQTVTPIKPVVTTTQPAPPEKVAGRPIPIEPILFTIEASNKLGTAKYEALLKNGKWNEKTEEFEWVLPEKTLALVDPHTQARIATVWLASLKVSNVTATKKEAMSCFQVKVFAEEKQETKFVVSSPLTITYWPNIPYWELSSKASVELKDINHDGAKAYALAPKDGIIWCSVNGATYDPRVFAKLIECVEAPPDKIVMVTECMPKEGGWLPAEVESHTISTEASFYLSAGDQATVIVDFLARPVKP